jgi:acetoin utilization deacetylase AcuC-like enzyme
MKWFYSESHRRHDADVEVWAGATVPSTEVVARAVAIATALSEDPLFEEGTVTEHGVAPIERVHDPALVHWLEGAWSECRPFSSRREVIPDTIRHAGFADALAHFSEPLGSAMGRLGYWCFDTMTPIVEGTYDAARGAVDVALSALDAVLEGESSAYALCRPPGHHAGRSMIGGFCYFNNAAIVAATMTQKLAGPVAVLDVDFHHGNGTQQIFYGRSDVIYVSLHADPDREFPYFAGRSDELGRGEGEGANRNFVLGAGVDDAQYLETLARALDFIKGFSIKGLVISLGVDTYELDPICDLKLTTAGYARMGALVAGLALPTVIVQEGGYHVRDIGINVRSWLRGYVASTVPSPTSGAGFNN